MQANQISLQDPESFRDLFNHTQLIIFRFIYGLHGGPVEEVEDLTCDTFLRAWKNRAGFTGNDQDALCWLFTIARHLVIDEHRRKKHHWDKTSFSLESNHFDEIWTTTNDTPEEIIARQEQFATLWQILQNLPNDKRELLTLRYMVGWQVKQIAKFLEKEENTVSVSIKRCLIQIRQKWPKG